MHDYDGGPWGEDRPAGRRRRGRVKPWSLAEISDLAHVSVMRLWACALEEKQRWPLWLPVALSLGIGGYFSLSSEPSLLVTSLPLLVLALALAVLHWGKPLWSERAPDLGYATFVTVIFVLTISVGFVVAKGRTDRLAAPVLASEIGPDMVTGTIAAASRLEHGGWRLVLRPQAIESLARDKLPQQVRLTVRQKDLHFEPGQTISILAKLMPPPEPVSPTAFDFARQAYFQQIGAVGFSLGRPEVLEQPQSDGFVRAAKMWIAGLRLDLAERIRAGLGGEAGAVAAALMTGNRDAISEETLEALRIAGLAHLLAISGLHMAMVAGLIYSVVRLGLACIEPWALRYPIKKWAAVAGAFGGLMYLLLSGASVSTQRAFIMISLMFLAVLLDRKALSMRVVAIAAMIILLWAPESLLSVSFQMSFAAVIALIAVYESQQVWRRRNPKDRLPEPSWPVRQIRHVALYLAGIGVTTLVAGMASGLFAAFHFNRVAAFGLVANLLAMPLVGLVIMPMAVLAFVLMPFGLEHLALAPMGWGIDWVVDVSTRVSSWTGAEHLVSSWPVEGLALMALGGVWLAIWQGPWRLFGPAVMAVGLVIALTYRMPDILVDREGKNIAVRASNGELVVLSAKRARFARETWLRRDGQQVELKARLPVPLYSCDDHGCITTDPDLPHISFVTDPAIFEEECQSAEILIADVPIPKHLARPCRAHALVIDRFDLWRHGAHAIWFDEGGLKVTHAAEERGNRPWSERK